MLQLLMSLEVGHGSNTPHCKKQLVMKHYTEPQTWTDSLEWPRLRTGASGRLLWT